MATKYVDSSATGANNGTSWADAWTALPTSGVAAGDTVYISGGSSTKQYDMSSYWVPPSGNSGARTTYKIGQSAGHNGVAILNYTGSAGNSITITGASYITFSGDAGDGLKHIKCNGYVLGVTNCPDSVVVEYVDWTDGVAQLVGMGGVSVSTFTLDHVDAKLDDDAGSTAIVILSSTDAWDAITISNCDIQLGSIASTGFGYDGVSCSKSFTLRNNTFRAFSLPGYSGGQHQDGWQALGPGSKIKIYGNRFLNMSNYGLYGEAIHGGYTDVRIYNNLFILSNPDIGNSAGGVIFGPQGSYDGASPCTFLRVMIANNTFVDYDAAPSIALNNVASPPVTCAWTDCVIDNNVFLNSGTINLTGNSSTVPANNVSVSAAAGSANFVTYTQNAGLSNNLHLLSGASALRGLGTDLATVFTTDYDGVTRVAWDIGAYEYVETGPTAPSSLSATAISASVIGLAWTNNASDADGNLIERSSDGTNYTQIASIGPTETTYPATGLASGTQFWFRARAYNANGNSAYSNVAISTTFSLISPTLTSGQAVGGGDSAFLSFF